MREYFVQVIVNEELMQHVFDLFNGDKRTRNFQMREIDKLGAPVNEPSRKPAPGKPKPGAQCNADECWPEIEEIFKAAHPQHIHYNDARLFVVMEKHGLKISNLSPIFSQLHRQGKLYKPHRGYYALPNGPVR